jgi:hypothetical protein
MPDTKRKSPARTAGENGSELEITPGPRIGRIGFEATRMMSPYV